MAQTFTSFQQLFTPATKWDWRLYETGIYFFKFSIKVFWVINSNGSWRRSCRDPLDTVDHEIDSIARGHHVYKSVWLPVIVEQLILEKEPASQSIWWSYSDSDKGFSDSGPHFVWKFIHRSSGILLHDGALSSAIRHLSYYWEKKERKKLGSTM